jgi:hypothetical protein
MAKIERLSVATADKVRRAAKVLRNRWDEGKASGRAGRLDVKRLLSEERASFKGGKGRRG